MPDSNPAVVFRVEIMRDETLGPDAVSIDVTAYIDRAPDDNEADFGCLSRVPANMWNTRMLFTGDFGSLADAVAAIAAAYPDAAHLNCYEWAAGAESALELGPLTRTGDRWVASAAADTPSAQLDWNVG